MMKPRILRLILVSFAFYYLTVTVWAVNDFDGNGTLGWFAHYMKRAFIDSSFISILCGIILTYLGFYWFYQRLGTIRTIGIYIIFIIPLSIVLRYLVQEVIMFHITGIHNYNIKLLTVKSYFLDNIYFAIHYSFIGLAFFFIQYEVFNKNQKQELLLQVRNAELSFLKSQLNPHFLFNSLNNLYTLVYQNSPNALNTISKLSELLRYMLYEKEDMVLLDREAKYLLNFIDLQLMRYDFSPATDICIESTHLANFKIAPLTLISFVENAFKHGDLQDAAVPLKIHLDVQRSALTFVVINKKSVYTNKDGQGGIGLQNVKKRLELLYKDRYTLQVENGAELYTVKLHLQLND